MGKVRARFHVRGEVGGALGIGLEVTPFLFVHRVPAVLQSIRIGEISTREHDRIAAHMKRQIERRGQHRAPRLQISTVGALLCEPWPWMVVADLERERPSSELREEARFHAAFGDEPHPSRVREILQMSRVGLARIHGDHEGRTDAGRQKRT